MHSPAGSRLGAVVPLSLALALSIATGTSASFATRSTNASYAEAPDASVAPVEIARPVRGANAVRVVGARLGQVAALNDMTGTELTELLRTDRTVWLDTEGIVFFKDEGAAAPDVDPISADAPLEQTLLLHSKPGSQHTVFLDFDGGAARATGWHAAYPSVPVTQPAWDPSGNGAVFDDAELIKIQTVWQIVAEDYAPFDVDVTTADPGAAAINRDSSADLEFGSHVLITPSVGAQQAICPSGCGGVAYVRVFDAVRGPGGDGYGYRQPAWVFPHQLGDSAKNVAEAASHEVGHNLGLTHDANTSADYDSGHGAWAPIMGVAYDRPITQWSRGDYAGANNTEDDLAFIGDITGTRADEASGSVEGAAALPAGAAYIGSRTDTDTYLLGTCTGTVTLTADPVASFADLDIMVSLLDSSGSVVAAADPASSMTSASVASGMAASLTQGVASGTYFVTVDGVGNGSWASGYDDYASLGAYTVAVSGCGSSSGSPPPTPTPGSTPTPTPSPTTTSAPTSSLVTTTGPLGSKTTPGRSASSTTVIRGPRKARAGGRPVMMISVLRGSVAASGKVVVMIGTKSRTLTLKAGTARLKLPRLQKKGTQTVTARYLGDASTATSRTIRRIKVKPARR